MTKAVPAPREVPFPPVEPPAMPEVFPDPRQLGEEEVAAVSRSMSPSLVLQAYRKGIFPWPVAQGAVAWYSPDPRCVFSLAEAPDWPRSLRKFMRKGELTVTYDRAFSQVMESCARNRPEGTWITPDIRRAYGTLHELGWTHSVEVWNATGQLVGGLYGLALGAIFAGESMFHRETNASKVAFVSLVDRLRQRGFKLLDAQVPTPHLASLGCVSMTREAFLARLPELVTPPLRFGGE
jgi:leucyl/phenylalanyl-tRNA--protein transferase